MIENNKNKDLAKESKQNQDNAKQIVSKPLKLETVNEGNNEDDVLVRGADKTVKFVPRSEFTAGGEDPKNLQQTLDNGSLWINEEESRLVSFFSELSPDDISFIYTGPESKIATFALGASTGVTFASAGLDAVSSISLHNNRLELGERGRIGGVEDTWSRLIFDRPIAPISGEAATFHIPAKGAGDHILATLEDINGAETPTIDTVLEKGNTATDKMLIMKASASESPSSTLSNGYLSISNFSGGTVLAGSISPNTLLFSSSNADTRISVSSADGVRMSADFGSTKKLMRNTLGGFYLEETNNTLIKQVNYGYDDIQYVWDADFKSLQLKKPNTTGSHFMPLSVNGTFADANGNIAVSSGGNQGLQDTLNNSGEALLEDGTSQTDIIFTAENDTSTVVLSGAKGSDVTTFSIDNGTFSLRNKQAGFGYNTLKFDAAQNSSSENVNLLIPSKNSAGDYKLATEDQINLQKIVENGTKYTDQYGNQIEFREGFAGYNSTLSFYPTGVMVSGIKNGKRFGASLNSDYVSASYEDKQIQLIPSEAAIYIQASYSASAKIRTNTLTADRNYQLPDKNGTIALTSDIATNNPNTVPLSLSYLNTSYPTAGIGFRVHCTGISGGGLIYEKTESGWVQYSVTKVN
jgi:hypothetical protein